MERIEGEQTKDIIATAIKRLVYSGELKDGDEITQNEVAESLSLSRMPVREAFLTLCKEGLLTRLPNRHVRVNGSSEKKELGVLKALIDLEVIALDFIDVSSSFLYEGELGWHKAYIKAISNKVLSAALDILLSGYLSYYLENNKSEDRLKILSLVMHDRSNAKRLLEEYQSLLATAIKEAFNA